METETKFVGAGPEGSRLESLKQVAGFLSNSSNRHRASSYLTVVGFPHIGKSWVLEEALNQHKQTQDFVVFESDETRDHKSLDAFAVARTIEKGLREWGIRVDEVPQRSKEPRSSTNSYANSPLKTWTSQVTSILNDRFKRGTLIIIWLRTSTAMLSLSSFREIAADLYSSGNRKIVVEQRRSPKERKTSGKNERKPEIEVHVDPFKPEEIVELLPADIEDGSKLALRDAIYRFFGTHPQVLATACGRLKQFCDRDHNLLRNCSIDSIGGIVEEIYNLDKNKLRLILNVIVSQLSMRALQESGTLLATQRIELAEAGLLVYINEKPTVATAAREYFGVPRQAVQRESVAHQASSIEPGRERPPDVHKVAYEHFANNPPAEEIGSRRAVLEELLQSAEKLWKRSIAEKQLDFASRLTPAVNKIAKLLESDDISAEMMRKLLEDLCTVKGMEEQAMTFLNEFKEGHA